MTIAAGAGAIELDGVRSAGSEVQLRASGMTDLETLMDPAQVPTALATGREQGTADAASLGDFWAG